MKAYQDEMFESKTSVSKCLMLALTLAGIAGITFAGAFFSISQNFHKFELKGRRTNVQQTLKEAISCQGTLSEEPATVCAKRFIDVVAKMPNGHEEIVISRFGSKYGHYTYRAECDSQHGIVIRAALPKSEKSIASRDLKDFRKDPETRKVYSWNDKDSLVFPEGSALCRGTTHDRILLTGTR